MNIPFIVTALFAVSIGFEAQSELISLPLAFLLMCLNIFVGIGLIKIEQRERKLLGTQFGPHDKT